MKIKPLTNYLLVKIDKQDVKTESGFFMPSPSLSSNWGSVISVGDKVEGINIGDSVIFNENESVDIQVKIQGDKLLLLKFEDILATVEK